MIKVFDNNGYRMTRDEFYNISEEWIKQDRGKWTHITLVAYFFYKYKSVNGVNFIPASWSGNPAKTKESRDFAELFKKLAPDNYDELDRDEKQKHRALTINKIYNYINWMFDFKFKRSNSSVSGTRLFLTPSLINEFERMYSAYIKKQENVGSFSAFLEWCKTTIPGIFDHQQLESIDDLKMINRYYIASGLSQDSLEGKLIAKAKQMGII